MYFWSYVLFLNSFHPVLHHPVPLLHHLVPGLRALELVSVPDGSIQLIINPDRRRWCGIKLLPCEQGEIKTTLLEKVLADFAVCDWCGDAIAKPCVT